MEKQGKIHRKYKVQALTLRIPDASCFVLVNRYVFIFQNPVETQEKTYLLLKTQFLY